MEQLRFKFIAGILVFVSLIFFLRFGASLNNKSNFANEKPDIRATNFLHVSSLNPYCIAAHLDHDELSKEDKENQMDLLKNSGANWVRFDFEAWRFMKGETSDFSYFDPVVDGLRKREIGIVAILPQWGETNDENYEEVIESPEVYAHYATHLASYLKKSGIAFVIELGNEPNDEGFWENRSAEEFTEYVVAGYDAIKEVDENIKVISGGVVMYTPAGEENGEFNAVDWLSKMYDSGIKSEDDHHDGIAKLHFDMYGVHIYPGRGNAERQIEEIKEIKNFMGSQGDNGEIAITEIGVPTGKDESLENVSEQMQAAFISGLYKDIIQNNEINSKIVCYYSLVDSGSSDEMEENYGLLDFDRSKKPAYSAYQDITSD